MSARSLKDGPTLTDLLKNLSPFLEKICRSLPTETDEVKLNRFHNAFHEAYQEIESKGYLDLTAGKFLYSTSRQVKYFAQFIPDQSDLESLLSVFEKFNKIFPEKFEVRAYACGNAVKEGLIFLNEFLSGRATAIHLHDYNDNVLKIAQNVVTGLLALLDGKDHFDETVRSSYRQQVITEDATDLEEHLPKMHKNNEKSVHLVLGNIISLVRNPQEVALNLNKTMEKGELAFVEWYARTPEDYNQGKLFQSNKDFLLNYFEAMGISQNWIRFDVDAEGKERLMEDEDEKYNLAYCFLDKNCTVNDLELKAETKLVGMRLRRFKEKELIDLFKRAGLEAMVLDESVEKYELWASEIPRTERIVHQQRWESIGDKRYAIFKKVREGPSTIRKIIVAGGIAALLGLFGGYLGNRPEKPIICLYKDSAYNLLTCVEKETGKKVESHLSDVAFEGIITEKKESNGLIIKVKGKKYFIPIDYENTSSNPFVLQHKVENMQITASVMSHSDRKNCNKAVFEYLKKGLGSDPKEVFGDLKNLLAWSGARYVYFFDCSGGDKKMTMDSEAFFQMYTDASAQKMFSPIYTGFVIDKLFESHLKMDNEVTKLLMRAFADQRVLNTFEKTSHFDFKKRYDSKTLLGFDRGEKDEVNGFFIIKLKTPLWYTLKFGRDFTDEKHIVDFIEKIVQKTAQSKSKMVLDTGLNFIDTYGDHLGSLVENGALLGSLFRICDYVPSENYADLLKLATRLVSVPHSNYVLMYLSEVAEKIYPKYPLSEGTNEPTDITQRRFVSLLEELNKLQSPERAVLPFYKVLKEISRKENMVDYLDDFSSLVQAINK